MTEPYDVDLEAGRLALDLVKLRPRLRLLGKNLADPEHAVAALRYLDLALGEVSEID